MSHLRLSEHCWTTAYYTGTFSLAALVSKFCCNSANSPSHCRLFANTVTQCFMFDFTYGCKLSTCGIVWCLHFLYHLWPKNKEMLHSVFVSTSWKASLLLQNFQCRCPVVFPRTDLSSEESLSAEKHPEARRQYLLIQDVEGFHDICYWDEYLKRVHLNVSFSLTEDIVLNYCYSEFNSVVLNIKDVYQTHNRYNEMRKLLSHSCLLQ